MLLLVARNGQTPSLRNEPSEKSPGRHRGFSIIQTALIYFSVLNQSSTSL
ncbi:MAG: hypothetical protein QOJ15_11571 [Bradyrhizobium sp.]|jgi:hypothetical protein|nr:hypothetical protein [Bradyrhizobium sp.]